jgi:hypothetical protein
MALSELISVAGSSIATVSTDRVEVLTENAPLSVEIWSTIFDAVTV